MTKGYKYTFVLTQLHYKLPDLLEWRLLVDADFPNVDVMLEKYEHRIMLKLADPHIKTGTFYANTLFDAINLYADRISRRLVAGEQILMNRNGGYSFYRLQDDKKRVERDTLMFPDQDIEIITLSTWPNGTHYYPTSNNLNRDFGGKKYKTTKAENRI